MHSILKNDCFTRRFHCKAVVLVCPVPQRIILNETTTRHSGPIVAEKLPTDVARESVDYMSRLAFYQ